ncbi:CDP-alcohol phosphatidyltransferase family protein [Haloferula sp. A504]|uniref:CDP-alcohol phosphatidyltransferase family protein n=1 Tax=Haloferula sp. A504 TaxID=3373601 RepID=UPI0031C4EEA5|nr:CDP-alcohol phosphatidyltransferase family protein [Verrucomicrobiaceae bacterium E54]
MISIQEQTERRRPLAARDIPLWDWLRRRLAGSGLTPNMVSVVGMLAGLGGGALLALTAGMPAGGPLQRGTCLAVIVLVVLRGACNIFDGVLAVETGRASRVGLLYNEVPDRVSDVAMLVGAGFAVGSHPLLGFAAALGALATAYVRVQVQIAGAPADYAGPMAKPARMVACVAALVALAAGPASWSAAEMGPMALALGVVVVGTAVTSVRRLVLASRHLESVRES